MIDEIAHRLQRYQYQEAPAGQRPLAAVLIPIYDHRGELHIVLTKRTDKVEHHKGEISFPGGAMDLRDADLTTTALRESEEEIGLLPDHVRVLGRVDDVVTVSRFHVTAYIGHIDPAFSPYPWRPQPSEVAEVLEVPIRHLVDRSNLIEVPRTRDGQTILMEGFQFGEHTIWGATARMLRNFLDVVGDVTPAEMPR